MSAKKKSALEFVILVSDLSGYRYGAWVNKRNGYKLELRKYDPIARKHTIFKQKKAPSPKKN